MSSFSCAIVMDAVDYGNLFFEGEPRKFGTSSLKSRKSKRNPAQTSLENRLASTQESGSKSQRQLLNLENRSIDCGMNLFLETFQEKAFIQSKVGQWKKHLQDRSDERKGRKLSPEQKLSFLQLLTQKFEEKPRSQEEREALAQYIRLSGIVSSLETTQAVLQHKLDGLTSHPVSDAKSLLRQRDRDIDFAAESASLEEAAEDEDYLGDCSDDYSVWSVEY